MRTLLSERRSQRMNAQPQRGVAPLVRTFPADGSPQIFVAPEAGVYRFILWGPGGVTAAVDQRGEGGALYYFGGGSGALAVVDRRMARGEQATILSAVRGVATTVTFADGRVVSAGFGGAGSEATMAGGLGGVATGGDLNKPGLRGGGISVPPEPAGEDGGRQGVSSGTMYGGAGAPGFDGLKGGNGADQVSTLNATTPGGGGSFWTTPGEGLVIAIRRS